LPVGVGHISIDTAGASGLIEGKNAMHELAVTQEIVAAIQERVGEVDVARVVLEIGTLCGVMPDALRFCFELCTRETTMEGAALEIVEIPAHAHCRVCAADFVPDRLLVLCACGSTEIEVLGGQELRIKEVEINV
jgi:hydrogenase nickel incorporation protein HypA/HybF